MHFGIRKNFYANRDKNGVEIIEEPTIITDENSTDSSQQLKHKLPKILDLKKGVLTLEETEFFMEYLDHEKMTEDLMEYWQTDLDTLWYLY